MGDPAEDDMDRILARFGEVQEEYEHLGGYSLEAQAKTIRSTATLERSRAAGRCAWRWPACSSGGPTSC